MPPAHVTPPRWLLLPGLDGSGELFSSFLEHVPGIDAVVVRYPDEPTADLDDYARHAASAIGDAPRCVVIAESFSGPVALRLHRFDERVVAIVLVASFVTCPHPLLRAFPVSAAIALARRAAFRPLLRAFCVGRDASRQCVERLRSVVRAVPADTLAARLVLLRSLDESATLRATRVPLLYLRALRDRLVRTTLPHDAMPASLREIAIDGPHFLLQARPRACREAIAAWAAHGGLWSE